MMRRMAFQSRGGRGRLVPAASDPRRRVGRSGTAGSARPPVRWRSTPRRWPVRATSLGGGAAPIDRGPGSAEAVGQGAVAGLGQDPRLELEVDVLERGRMRDHLVDGDVPGGQRGHDAGEHLAVGHPAGGPGGLGLGGVGGHLGRARPPRRWRPPRSGSAATAQVDGGGRRRPRSGRPARRDARRHAARRGAARPCGRPGDRPRPGSGWPTRWCAPAPTATGSTR